MGTRVEWPTFRRIVVDAFQSAGQVMQVGQEASSLTGMLGLVTAGVGITIFCGMPRFCGENAIAARPIVTDPPVLVETHLAWRRTSINVAMRRFVEASQKVGAAIHDTVSRALLPAPAVQGKFRETKQWRTGPTGRR